MKTAVPAAALAIVTFAYRYLSFGHFPNDHFVHLARAQQITMGAWPVRDFAESGLPLMSILSALAQKVFGRGLHAELLLVSAAFAIAAALFFIVAARLTGSMWIGVVAAVVPTLAYPATYSYPKMLPYAAAFVAAWFYVINPSRLRLLVLASAVVAAFLFRHDHGLILGSGASAAVMARHGITRDSRTAVTALALASVFLVTPYVLWVQRYEGVASYVSDGIAFTQREIEKATRRPPSFSMDLSQPLFTTVVERHGPVVHVQWVSDLPEPAVQKRESAYGLHRLDPVGPKSWQYELSSSSSSTIRRLVTDPAVADTQGIDRQTFQLAVDTPRGTEQVVRTFHGEGLRLQQNAVAVIYYFVWVLPAAAALILILRWSELSPPVRSMAVMAILVQLMMDRLMLRDPMDTRVRDVVAPTVILLAFIAAFLFNRGAATVGHRARRLAAVALLVIVVGTTGVMGSVGEHLQEMQLTQGMGRIGAHVGEIRQRLAYPDNPGGSAHQPEGIVDYLATCTTPDARLFTMTFAPELFLYAQRGFAAGHESLVPGFYVSDRAITEMLDRLSREEVPFVIMDSETMHDMRANYPRLIAHVDGHYREAGRFPMAVGKEFVVFADADRPRAGVYGRRALPCFAAPGGARPLASR